MGENSITGKQRMEAALNGEKLDRHPVLLILGGQYAEAAGYTLEQFLTQPDAALETVRLTCEELDSDAIFVPLNPLMPDAQEAFRKLMGKPLSIKKDNIKEKLPKWTVRLPREDPLFSGHLDMCEKCVDEFPEYHVETMIGGPWSFALELRGANEAMLDIYDDTPFLHDLMEYSQIHSCQTPGNNRIRCVAHKIMQERFIVIDIQHSLIGPAQFQGKAPGTADHGLNMISGEHLDTF